MQRKKKEKEKGNFIWKMEEKVQFDFNKII